MDGLGGISQQARLNSPLLEVAFAGCVTDGELDPLSRSRYACVQDELMFEPETFMARQYLPHSLERFSLLSLSPSLSSRSRDHLPSALWPQISDSQEGLNRSRKHETKRRVKRWD